MIGFPFVSKAQDSLKQGSAVFQLSSGFFMMFLPLIVAMQLFDGGSKNNLIIKLLQLN